MLLRAIFWIAVVAILMPHGHVGGGANACASAPCSAGFELLEHIKASGLQSLAQVRADIETDERAREGG
jgi:hypothetical protein